uniref:RING-type domain-containing protein n=1 Tax=Leersia perrieri TaxID=77586 RepID=A0A0D9V068_9ORYZ
MVIATPIMLQLAARCGRERPEQRRNSGLPVQVHFFSEVTGCGLWNWNLSIGMSDRGASSSVAGDTDTDAVPTADAPTLWAPHGRALTGCLVVVNVALVLLVYLYFWRVFSRKRAAAADSAPSDDDDDDSSSSASAPPTAAMARIRDDVVASLPVFVVRSSAAGGEKAAAAAGEGECAVCIGELRDGDECRALPRCGHRFHAACVDAWLRLHANCPLCRASVVGGGVAERKCGVTDTTAAAQEDMDARV